MELSKKSPEMSEDDQFALLGSDGMLAEVSLCWSETILCSTGFKEEEWKEKLGNEIK